MTSKQVFIVILVGMAALAAMSFAEHCGPKPATKEFHRAEVYEDDIPPVHSPIPSAARVSVDPPSWGPDCKAPIGGTGLSMDVVECCNKYPARCTMEESDVSFFSSPRSGECSVVPHTDGTKMHCLYEKQRYFCEYGKKCVAEAGSVTQ